MKKGLTPLVATVLLIGFTIGVGTLLGLFVNTLMKSQIKKTKPPCTPFIDLRMKIVDNDSVKVMVDYSLGSEEILNASVIVVCENISKVELGKLKPGNITLVTLGVKNCDPQNFLVKLSGDCGGTFQTLAYCENDRDCLI